MPLKRAKVGPLPKSAGVRSEAVTVLMDRLGMSKASLFIRDTMSMDTDYLQIKERLFSGNSVDDLVAEI